MQKDLTFWIEEIAQVCFSYMRPITHMGVDLAEYMLTLYSSTY